MLRLFFVLLIGGAFGLVGTQPSAAQSKSFLGGAIAGGVGVMLFNSLNNRNNNRAQPAPQRRAAPPPRRVPRRVIRKRHPSAALEPRMNRETKREVQQALNDRDFKVGFADGSFGGKTRRGIRRFQSSISAPVTGYLTRRQVKFLLEPVVEPQNTIAGRTPAPAQGYTPAPAYSASPTYNNAQTFQSLETAPKPVIAVASRGYSSSSTKSLLEDAPQ